MRFQDIELSVYKSAVVNEFDINAKMSHPRDTWVVYYECRLTYNPFPEASGIWFSYLLETVQDRLTFKMRLQWIKTKAEYGLIDRKKSPISGYDSYFLPLLF